MMMMMVLLVKLSLIIEQGEKVNLSSLISKVGLID